MSSDQPRRPDGTYDKGHTISDEQRERMNAGLAAKRPAEIRALTDELLEAAGVDPKDAPPDLKIVCKKAAAGDVNALKLYLSQTKQLVRQDRDKVAPPKVVVQLSAEAALALQSWGVGVEQECPKCHHKFKGPRELTVSGVTLSDE